MVELPTRSSGALPKVVIDGRMVGPVPHGIARYVRLLAKGLAEQRELSFAPVFLAQAGMEDAFAGFESHVVHTPFLDMKEAFLMPIVLKRLKPALYHSPSFSSLAHAPCPYVVTVHDLNHLQFGGIVEKLYYEAVLRPFLQKAKVVLTVSEFSKQELARWNSKLKLEVVYNAIDPVFSPSLPEEAAPARAVLEKYGVRRGRYFLCLGNAKPHKNLGTLVRAFQKFRESSAEFADFKLLLSVKRYIAEPNVLALDGAGDLEIRRLIEAAAASPFPSLYEGFGLPPIEAACVGGVPLPSRIPAHLEGFSQPLSAAAFGSVRFTPAEDIAAWAESLKTAALGRVKPLPQSDRLAIFERYSVQRLGAEMKRVYERILK